MPASVKIPVYLVTGFLGSGKTTFLQCLALDHPDWHLSFLVNEFANASIDGDSLVSLNPATHSVVGGSLFCQCKAAEFVRVLKSEVLAEHQRRPLDALVIETSGIADPEAIGRIMKDFDLDRFFRVESIISLVSPRSLPKLLASLPNVAAQIRSSDTVLINKTDLVETEQVDQAESLIRENNPEAVIRRGQFGQFSGGLASGRKRLPELELSTVDANPFSTRILELDQPVSEQSFQTWAQTLPDTILRVKGTVLTSSGWFHLEGTVDSLQMQPVDSAMCSRLVLITHDDDEVSLEACCQSFFELC